MLFHHSFLKKLSYSIILDGIMLFHHLRQTFSHVTLWIVARLLKQEKDSQYTHIHTQTDQKKHNNGI